MYPPATNPTNGETERPIAKNEEKAGDPAQNQTVSSSQRLHQVRGEEARKAKEEEETRAREAAAAKKAKEEEEKRVREAAAKKAKEDEEKRAKEAAAAKKAKEDEEKRVKEAASKKAREEEEKRVREAATKKAKEEEEKRAKEAAAKKEKEEEAKASAAKKAKEEEEKRKAQAGKDDIPSQQDGISHGQRTQLLREEERKKKEKESAAKAKEGEKEEGISHAQRLHQMREQEEKKQKEEGAKQPEKVPTSPVQQETISHGQRLYQMRGQEEKKQKEAVEVLAIEFDFSREIGRFLMRFNDPSINYISLSEQLAYVLGFPDRHRINNGEIAKYGPDMNGGFGSFAVYCNGLTRSVIMGNSLSSMLRIVAVEGTYGQMVERIYDHPMFIPVLPREINEIEVELRLMNGAHVPFQFGSVIVILAFKRVINF